MAWASIGLAGTKAEVFARSIVAPAICPIWIVSGRWTTLRCYAADDGIDGKPALLPSVPLRYRPGVPCLEAGNLVVGQMP